jgi:hypothetical protein
MNCPVQFSPSVWTAVHCIICLNLREAIPFFDQNRYRENLSNTTKGDLLLHKETSFNPTMGSSSGDYIRIKEIKSTSLHTPHTFHYTAASSIYSTMPHNSPYPPQQVLDRSYHPMQHTTHSIQSIRHYLLHTP